MKNLRSLPLPLTALAVGAMLLAGCAREPRRPNLILISIDTLRPDHLGIYGYERPTSPELDAFAREAVVFDRAYSTSNWTLPAHLSMLTGLYPAEHGVHAFRRAVAPEVELLSEALGEHGYRSAAVVSAVPFLTARHGLARGWQVYDDVTAYPSAGKVNHHQMVTSDLVHGRAVELLDQLAGEPFFLFLHYFDVHDQYRPPPPYDKLFTASVADEALPADLQKRAARLAARYDGEIRWVDSWLGKLFDELERRELAEDTLVVVTSDHGEEFGEHGELYHGKNLFDTSIRVPLIVRLPRRAHAGRRIETPVSLVDLGATLLGAAGRSEPVWHSGRDLRELLTPEPDPVWRTRPLMVTGLTPGGLLTAVLERGRKVVTRADAQGRPVGPRLRVIPFERDPTERTVQRLRPRDARRQRERLLALWQEQRRGGHRSRALAARAAQEEAAALKALGYL